MTPSDRPTDPERIAMALRFYLERCTWSAQDRERGEFERLLARYDAEAKAR